MKSQVILTYVWCVPSVHCLDIPSVHWVWSETLSIAFWIKAVVSVSSQWHGHMNLSQTETASQLSKICLWSHDIWMIKCHRHCCILCCIVMSWVLSSYQSSNWLTLWSVLKWKGCSYVRHSSVPFFHWQWILSVLWYVLSFFIEMLLLYYRSFSLYILTYHIKFSASVDYFIYSRLSVIRKN